jgi:DNA primase
VRRLKRHARRVDLLFDGDAAGLRAALRALEVTVNEGLSVQVAVLPAGEDPDSLLRGQGPEGLQRVLDGAIPLFELAVRELLAAAGGDDFASRLGALRKLLPVARTIREPVERRLFVEHVAAAFDLPADQVEGELGAAAGRPVRTGAGPPAAPAAASRGLLEAAFGVLWFLSEHPESFDFLKALRVDACFPGESLQALMAEILACERFPAEILEAGLHAGGGELAAELARRVLSEYAHLPDPVAAFNDWVRVLRRRHLERQERQVRQRLRQAEEEADAEGVRVGLKALILHREEMQSLSTLVWEGQKK